MFDSSEHLDTEDFVSHQQSAVEGLYNVLTGTQSSDTNTEIAHNLSLLLDKCKIFVDVLRSNQERVGEDSVTQRSKEAISLDSVLNRCRMKVQRPNIKLRNYQKFGVQWMAALHDSGLNGILADEMGLGKTLQVLSLLRYLYHTKGIWGPHVIIAPLSVLSSWQHEIEKVFGNAFEVKLHCGANPTREEEFLVWKSKQHRRAASARDQAGTVAVLLTSYEICQRDLTLFKHFRGKSSKIGWYYMIVDEAHRLKNSKSYSFNNLITICSRFRLLLTGTPIQNNLNELWSILYFILPNLFNDHALLYRWFNKPFEESDSTAATAAKSASSGQRPGLHGHSSTDSLLSASASSMSLSSLRLPSAATAAAPVDHDPAAAWADANRGVSSVADEPAERERIGGSSEKMFILSTLHKVIEPFILRRLKCDVAIEIPQKIERLIVCPLSKLQLEVLDVFRDNIMKLKQNSNWSSDIARSSTSPSSASKQKYQKRNSLEKASPTAFKLGLFAGVTDETINDKGNRSMTQIQSQSPTSPDRSKTILGSHNIVMQLRKLCNHPFLILETLKSIPDDLYFQHVIASSGKLAVLNRLLPTLLSVGHKVLIFSQMTAMLDILQGYLQGKGWRCFRVDGSTKVSDREAQIAAFNSQSLRDHNSDAPAEVVNIFLLSTRAGGVGINLQSADTVILFDSDWNPQMDLQAISRAHRIGQSKTVLVLRLVSSGAHPDCSPAANKSIETLMLKRAALKLKTEELVFRPSLKRHSFGQENSMGLQSLDGGNNFKSTADSVRVEGENTCGAGQPVAELTIDDEDLILDDKTLWALLSSAWDDSSSSFQQGAEQTPSSVHDTALSACEASELLDCILSRSIDKKEKNPHVVRTEFSNGNETYFISPEMYNSFDLSKWDKSHWMSWLTEDIVAVISAAESATDSVADSPLEYHPFVSRKSDIEQSLQLDSMDRKRLSKIGSKSRVRLELENERMMESSDETNNDNSMTFLTKSKRVCRRNIRFARDIEEKSSDRSSPGKSSRNKDKPGARIGSMNSRLKASDTVEMVYDNDICVICGEGDRNTYPHQQQQTVLALLKPNENNTLMLCDGCDGGFHLNCIGLQQVPVGNWFCRFCESISIANR